MKPDSLIRPSNIYRRDRFSKFLCLLMILAAVILAASFGCRRVSAEIETNTGELSLQEASNATLEDFVVAFMDSPTGSILEFNIKAGGFNGDRSRSFPEIPVNTDNGPQLTPDVAIDSSGDFVVVWADDRDKNGLYQILARGFNSDGSQRFPTFTVNTVAAGNQIAPTIAMTPSGDFAVAWQDDQDGNDVYQIHARGFNSDGSQRFSTITANTIATGDQSAPAIAMAPNGDFVVAWQNDNSLDGSYNILARGFNSDGSQRIPWFNVNTALPGDQRSPEIAMDDSGNFVITWQDDQDGNGVFQIHARGFYSYGIQRFSTITVNSEAAGNQIDPQIAMALNGNFVVTWEDDQDGNGIYQVLARGFHPTGSERIPDFTVNSVGSGNQIAPNIAMDGSGDFVITWQDDQDRNGVYQILARGFYSDGSEHFHDYTVNEKAAGQQWLPAIAAVRKKPTVYLPIVVR